MIAAVFVVIVIPGVLGAIVNLSEQARLDDIESRY